MSVCMMDDWKLKTSPVVKLEKPSKTFVQLFVHSRLKTHLFHISFLRWPVGATVHKSFNYLWARDNYLWPRDNYLWARLIISGPEILSLAQRKYLWPRDNFLDRLIYVR